MAGAVGAALAAAAAVIAAVAAAVTAVAAAALAEVDIVNDHLGAAALAALPVGPIPYLQTAGNDGHAAFLEIFADKFGGLTPGNTVDKIGLFFTAVTAAVITVNGQGETCYRRLGLGISELLVPGQTAHDGDVVKHSCAPYSARRVIRRRSMPSVIPRIRSSSAGNSGALVNFIST